MNFITKNLKQAGVFNTILIVITIILQIYLMFVEGFKPALQPYNYVMIIASIFGLIYAFYGYKKHAAKYYKAFIFLALIAFVLSAISFVPNFSQWKIGTCLAFVRIIPIALLGFIKDFGKKNSLICAYVAFVCSSIIFISAIMQNDYILARIALGLIQVLISAITIVFVEAKYADKASRGAK